MRHSAKYWPESLWGFLGLGCLFPGLAEICGDGFTGRKAPVKRFLVDLRELACHVDDVILQTDQDIFFPVLTKFRRLAAVSNIRYRFIKQGAILRLPFYGVICFGVLRPVSRETANQITEDGQLLLFAMGGEVSSMFDEPMEA